MTPILRAPLCALALQTDRPGLLRVDRIVFGKNLSVAEIESVRSILSALRARRLMRGKTAKAY
jgi:hypothetical protein